MSAEVDRGAQDELDLRRATLARLTPPQRFIVVALERGYSPGWIAAKLRCSRSTVFRRLEAARRRAAATDRVCLACGEILPPSSTRSRFYCGSACRAQAWRSERKTGSPF